MPLPGSSCCSHPSQGLVGTRLQWYQMGQGLPKMLCPAQVPLPCPAPRRIPIKLQTITHHWAVLDKRLHYFWLPLPWGSWKPGIQGSHGRALFKQVLLIELRGEKEMQWNSWWGGKGLRAPCCGSSPGLRGAHPGPPYPLFPHSVGSVPREVH